MKKVDELKLQRTAKFEAQIAIVDLATEEKRNLSAEDNAQIETLKGEIEALDREIDALEAVEATRMRLAGMQSSKSEEKEKEKIVERFSISKMIRDARNGVELTGAEKEMNEIGAEENRKSGAGNLQTSSRAINIPLSALRASQQTVTQDGGGFGGALVDNQAPRVVDGFRPKLFLQEMGATLLTGLTGGNIPFPVANDYSLSWLAEGASATVQKNAFAGPTLSPKRAAGAVSFSNQLLNQSSVAVDALISEHLRRGWETTIQSAAINGAGGDAPTGILNTAGIQTSTVTAAAAPTFEMAVELQSLISTADAGGENEGYLLRPNLEGTLKTTKKDAGSGRFVIENGTLADRNYRATSLVPTGLDGATVVNSLIYGDFSKLIIGTWGGLTILVNPYAEDLADSVRLVLNAYAGVVIPQPAAFAVNNFLIA